MGEPQCAVMVRIRGPDPKSRKMLRHAFHAADSGETTLSASGVLLPLSGAKKSAVVVTCALIVEPFLPSSAGDTEESIELVRGTHLEVLVQARDGTNGLGLWLPARILKLMNVDRAEDAVKSLLEVQGGEGVWEMGWALGKSQESLRETVSMDAFPIRKEMTLPTPGMGSAAAAFTRIAVLALQSNPPLEMETSLRLADACAKGDVIKAVGSPFGALSPLHFFNSNSVGIVSNCWPPSSSSSLVLMADIRVLPGMEGGPVFDAAGNLVGILLTPLRQRSSGAEVHLVLLANVLLLALQDVGLSISCSIFDGESLRANEHIQNALPSITLVTSGNGSWASGIILNKAGLILTNAHLLEPWRFGRLVVDPSNSMLRETHASSRKPYPPVQVRVRRQNTHSWHFATVVFVSHGALDVALLQLSSVPSDLQPVVIDDEELLPGSTAAVIGHGLFGPRSELGPSITIGIVSRVVNTREVATEEQDLESNIPVMLQTTAAVYPGGSGGAVLNSKGRMIGLVTSNAKHGGVKVIPYLNFSIPCAMLRPVFRYAESGDFSKLAELDKKNNTYTAIWSMVDPLQIAPRLPYDVKKEGKGSRFAKFIADNRKKTGFDSLPQQIKSML